MKIKGKNKNMITPLVVSFIASLVFLNSAVLPISKNFSDNNIDNKTINYAVSRTGSVLGVNESRAEENTEISPVLEEDKIKIEAKIEPKKIIAEAPKDMSNSVMRVVDDLKNITKDSLEVFHSGYGLPVSKEKNASLIKNPYDLKAKSGVVYDVKNNNFVFKKNQASRLPIASITKLMTAIVFIENNPSFDEVYEIKNEDRREGGRIYVYRGDKILVKDLFNLSLVGSANTATVALVHSTGMTEEEFVSKMNEKAKDLGLMHTNFKETVGLSANNYSTANDIALLAREALSYPQIREATLRSSYSFKTLQGRTQVVYTTDQLLNNMPKNGVELFGGKTGYTDAAGYCFVGGFVNETGQELISVVLGTESDKARFSETKNLINWVFENIK
jgi:D-alanyl-D-alanine carboxypeptidase